MSPYQNGFGPVSHPTESQCSYIRKMAEALDIDLEYGWETSWTKKQASDWIDENQADFEVSQAAFEDGW